MEKAAVLCKMRPETVILKPICVRGRLRVYWSFTIMTVISSPSVKLSSEK